ncbi:Uncharacterised protein [Chlamydia trachomatis]|nr:Uncharacterised protein [Chlamydia trachomatis]
MLEQLQFYQDQHFLMQLALDVQKMEKHPKLMVLMQLFRRFEYEPMP